MNHDADLTQQLTAPVPQEAVDRLRADLAQRADDADLLDVAYRTVPTPIGELLIATTPAGVVRVAFAGEDFDAVLTDLAARISPRVLHAPARLDPAARQIEEYFDGRRRNFDVAVDLSLIGGFRREVLDELQTVPLGVRVTYTELAARSGRARAVRAAASACAQNPVPVVVPCHRVVRTDGTLGGYRGGLPAKETLLALESAAA